MKTEERHIFFFDWFNNYFEDIRSSLQVAMVKTISRSWKIERGPDIDSIHPPFEPVLVDGGIRASPVKLFVTGFKETPKVEYLGHIIEQ